MSLILGIASSHDSSACIFRDGRLVAAVSEERMSRIKCDGYRIPHLAIAEVLRLAGVQANEVTGVALICGFFPERYFHHLTLGKRLEAKLKALKNNLAGNDERYINANDILKRLNGSLSVLKTYFRTDEFLADHDLPAGIPVSFFDHHETHAVCAAFYSGFPSAAVITCDGKGDLYIHQTSSIWRDGKLQRIHMCDRRGTSAGEFYEAITVLLGFRALRHEGKVLGLAAYGNPEPLRAPFRRALRLSADGTQFESDFNNSDPEHARFEFLKSSILGHRKEEVAAATQAVFEETLIGLIRNFLRETGESCLALNGGVFANVKLNQRLAALPEVERLFVYPAMSDCGISVGAALLLQEQLMPGYLGTHSYALDHVYSGAVFSSAEIAAALAEFHVNAQEIGTDAVIECTAQAIHSGKVVGWFQGGMEFGPRALGNRSMVAAPTDGRINVWLNERLERTEFMPFAPSVLAEDFEELFGDDQTGTHAAEFMTITYDVKDCWRPRIPAVVHVDGTARPQCVRADRNPLYHRLIRRYKELSGIPLVLNTSFNVHEEPIVCAPGEAIRALQDGRIDALAIGSYWATRSSSAS